jgi:hypothetical protein
LDRLAKPLQLDRDPVVANWDQAILKASQTKVADLHIWAIDQPMCVRNKTGTCRPVEQDLARALMNGTASTMAWKISTTVKHAGVPGSRSASSITAMWITGA